MSSNNNQRNRNVDLRTVAMAAQRNVLKEQIREENLRYKETRGVSYGNRRAGFLPTFRDKLAECIYLSRFANGQLAPIHGLDGVPKHLYKRDMKTDYPVESKQRVISGFVRGGRFFFPRRSCQLG